MIMVFTRMGITGSLYEIKGDHGVWCGLLICEGMWPEEISVSDALTDQSMLASFLLLAGKPEFASEEEEHRFTDSIRGILDKKYCDRALLWILDMDAPENCFSLCALSRDGSLLTKDSLFSLETGISVLIRGQSSITLTGEQDGIIIGSEGHNTAVFSGRYSPMTEAGSSDLLTIRFQGEEAGSITYEQRIPRRILMGSLCAGFQVMLPSTGRSGGDDCMVQWYPFAPEGEDGGGKYLFSCHILPLSPKGTFDGAENRYLMEAGFYFGDAGVLLDTWYLTPDGKKVELMPVSWKEGKGKGCCPAGFRPVPGAVDNQGAVLQKEFVFSPVGDYMVSGGKESGRQEIMCGLNGVEKLVLRHGTAAAGGDFLRFSLNGAAYVPYFPLPQVSPLEKPVDTDNLLQDRFQMSYVSAVAGSQGGGFPCYIAQPEEARLFGKAEQEGGTEEILLPREPGIVLAPPPEEAYFPMVPYGGVRCGETGGTLTAQQIQELEKTVLAAVRKKILDENQLGQLRRNRCAWFADGVRTAVTPSGVLVDLEENSGIWENIRLGQCMGSNETYDFGFDKPDTELQQAFASGQLCLVAANDSHIAAEKGFKGSLEVDGWEFSARVGRENRYGDYRSVMIIKSCRGTLLELAENPSKWTMADTFAAPSLCGQDGSVKAPDRGQLAVLSQWIVQYMEKAAGKGELYENFNRLVRDENWSGVLVLKAAVTELPRNLEGLTAGLDRNRFFVHHFAVDFSNIDATSMSQSGTSSISGLIDYSDVLYDDSMGEVPVTPGKGDYDFKVLRLVCLFEHALVRRFYSLVQLCMRSCFGSGVLSMEDPQNIHFALLLHGSYQNHGDTPVYQMTIAREDHPAANTFLMDNDVLKGVRITEAQMSTEEEKDGAVVSCITMGGFLRFQSMEYEDEQGGGQEFDIYSYGEEDVGLVFRDLAVRITQQDEGGVTQLRLDTGRLHFDSARSQARNRSLASQFSMRADGLVSGEEKLPGEMGYLPITGDVRLGTLEKGEWYGIRLLLDLGSPGALASSAGLQCEVLMAWGISGGGTKGFLGLKLPGTSGGGQFFSLENVLKLSIGFLRLTRDREKDAFVLILTDIALKLLGIVGLPPAGSTCFYLFADPEGKQTGKGLGWYAAYNREPVKKKNDVELTEVTGATEITEVTEVTEVTDVTEITEITEVTEITEAAEVTETMEATEITELTDAAVEKG